MNQENSADFNMMEDLEDLFTADAAILAPFLPIVPKLAQYAINMDAIRAQKAIHELDKSGYRPANVLLKILLSETISRYSILASDYFMDIVDGMPFALQLNKKAYLLIAMKNADLVTYCRNNVAIFSSHYTPLAPYHIDAPLVLILNAMIDHFDTDKSNPHTKQLIKNLAGKTERVLDDENIVLLHSFDRTIPNFFKTTQPVMVGLYEASRKKNILGRRHNNLGGLITAAITGIGLENVKIKNVDSGKETFSDIDGNYLLEQMVPGKYHFEITLAGYQTIYLNIEIIFRETVIHDFTMTLLP